LRYYFDTSALVRYYHPELGSDQVERIILEPGATHLLSWLTVVETHSAFALKARIGEITAADVGLLRTRLKTHIAERRFLVNRVLRRHYDRAERLLMKYGPTLKLRSLDALHLAIALDLREWGHVDTLVTADATLDKLGRNEGLSVNNPLGP
jgi:predicted nucleic acid-binding protein